MDARSRPSVQKAGLNNGGYMRYLILLLPLLISCGALTDLARSEANKRAEKAMAQGYYGPPGTPVDFSELRRQQAEDELNRQILWELQNGKPYHILPHD